MEFIKCWSPTPEREDCPGMGDIPRVTLEEEKTSLSQKV